MLNETNKLCDQCNEKCKQFEQIIIMKCDSYQNVLQEADKGHSSTKQGVLTTKV